MAVTATTAEEIFVGAGEVYIDDELVGATMENNLFRVVQEKGSPKLNGVPGPILGIDYISSETAELECTVPNLGAAHFAMAIPGAVSTSGEATAQTTTTATDLDEVGGTAVGDTVITVTSATGLAVNDVIQIGSTGKHEFRKITAVATNDLTLDAPLTKAHVDTEPVLEVTATTLAAEAAAGATNLKVTSVTGLAVGDWVRFGYPTESEVRQLTFVGTTGSGGTGVSFDIPTARLHRNGDTLFEQTSSGASTITSGAGLARRIPSTAYHKVELVVPGLDGRERRFVLLDAIMTENPEYEASDDPESPLAPRLTWQARWDPAASTTSPWRIDLIDAA